MQLIRLTNKTKQQKLRRPWKKTTKSKWVKKIRTCSDKLLKNSRKRMANLRNWPTISTKCLRIQMIKAIQKRKRKNQKKIQKRKKRRKRRKKKRKRRIKRIRRRQNRMRKIMLREVFVIAIKKIKRRSTKPRSSSRKSSLKMIK